MKKRVTLHQTTKHYGAAWLKDYLAWETAPPFVVNPRGILVHRIFSGGTRFREGVPYHAAVKYWCGNQCCIDQDLVNDALVDTPPGGRLLCSLCEYRAAASGEMPADTLVGRHVHVGVLRAHRVCCPNRDMN